MLGRRKFIVIEGLIGVGKTSLCRILQRRWKARLVLEPCDDNPFLAAFYADRERYAFPAQMFYLATRGLDTEAAISLLINGFCKEVFRKLPLEFSVEAVKLLEMKLEGSVG